VPYGMHSPFGRLEPIITKTGWSIHHILWKVNWSTIIMIMSDAPGIKSIKKGNKKVIKMSGKDYAARLKSKKTNGG